MKRITLKTLRLSRSQVCDDDDDDDDGADYEQPPNSPHSASPVYKSYPGSNNTVDYHPSISATACDSSPIIRRKKGFLCSLRRRISNLKTRKEAQSLGNGYVIDDDSSSETRDEDIPYGFRSACNSPSRNKRNFKAYHGRNREVSSSVEMLHSQSKKSLKNSGFAEKSTSPIDQEKRLFPIDTEYGHASAPTLSDHSSVRMRTQSIGNDSQSECCAPAPSPCRSHARNDSLSSSGVSSYIQPASTNNVDTSSALVSQHKNSISLPLQRQNDDASVSGDPAKGLQDVREGWSLTKELFKLTRYGWYWGPINRVEAEEKLVDQCDGAFLVRDSSDDRYLLSLSFRSYGRTLHTRIEHCNGVFSFYAQPESEGYTSIVALVEQSMTDSQSGVFCYSRARTPGSPSFPVRLTRPVSRFTYVRSLQYLCRFVIRQYTRLDHIQELPLPPRIKSWLGENQY